MPPKTRIALLGCGGIQGKHVRTFLQRQDADIVALCDVSSDITAAFATRLQLDKHNLYPAHFTDPQQMYRDAKPDAVTICTPHTLHFQQAMQALDHGCHILMEKPMVTDADHAYTLADAVRKAGKVFLVAYNTPCSPEFEYLRNLIRTGELGRLELVSGWVSQGWMKGTTGKWRQDPALAGGGMAYDTGAHPLASLTWSVESRVAEVFAFVDNHGTPVDINSTINIRFENGVFACLAIGGNCPANGSSMTFIFDNGRVDIDPWSAGWIKVHKAGRELKYPPITGEPTQPADNFLDAIAGQTQPRTTPDNGIVHSELMDAIYESARTNQPARPRNRP
jgi:predicted dehydrogenase